MTPMWQRCLLSSVFQSMVISPECHVNHFSSWRNIKTWNRRLWICLAGKVFEACVWLLATWNEIVLPIVIDRMSLKKNDREGRGGRKERMENTSVSPVSVLTVINPKTSDPSKNYPQWLIWMAQMVAHQRKELETRVRILVQARTFILKLTIYDLQRVSLKITFSFF